MDSINYENIFENMPYGFVKMEAIYDSSVKLIDFRFVKTNRAYEKLSGFFQTEGRTLKEIYKFNEESLRSKFERYKEYLNSQTNISYNSFAPLTNKWLHINAFSPEEDIIIVFFEDITKQKRNELLFSKVESNSWDIFNKMNCGFVKYKLIFDTSGKISDITLVSTNPAYYKLTGTEISGKKNISDLLFNDPKEYFRMINAFQKMFDTQSSFKFEKFFCGSGKWLCVSSYLLNSNEIVAIFEDIKKEEEIKATSENTESAYERLIRALPIGIARGKIIRDGEGKTIDVTITDTNSAYEKIFSNKTNKGKKATELLSDGSPFKSVLSRIQRYKNEVSFTLSDEVFFPSINKTINYYIYVTDVKNDELLLIVNDITEYNKDINSGNIRKDLNSNSKNYNNETLLDEFIDSFFVIDNDWKIKYINKVGANHLGKSPKELIGRSIETCNQKIRESGIIKFFEEAMSIGETSNFETKIIDLEGKSRNYLFRSMPIENDTAFLVVDITDFEKRTKELTKMAIRYNTLFNESNEGILFVDLDGIKFIGVNPAICKMFGYTKEEMLKLGVKDIHPVTSHHYEYIFSKFKKGEQTFAYNVECVKKDGSIFFVSIHISFIKNDEETLLAGMFTDITKEIYANDELIKKDKDINEILSRFDIEEQKFKIIVENAFDVEFWISTEGRAIYYSLSCEKLTGYSAEEFYNNPNLLVEIVDPADISMFNDKKLFKKQVPLEMEFRIRRKDGKIRWVFYKLYPIYDKSDNWIGTRGKIRDITKQVLTELKLKQISGNLEAQVQNRTQELERSMKDLSIAKEELFRYTRMIDIAEVLSNSGSFYVTSIRGNLTWSANLYRLFGLSPLKGNINISEFFEMIHPDDKYHIVKKIRDNM